MDKEPQKQHPSQKRPGKPSEVMDYLRELYGQAPSHKPSEKKQTIMRRLREGGTMRRMVIDVSDSRSHIVAIWVLMCIRTRLLKLTAQERLTAMTYLIGPSQDRAKPYDNLVFVSGNNSVADHFVNNFDPKTLMMFIHNFIDAPSFYEGGLTGLAIYQNILLHLSEDKKLTIHSLSGGFPQELTAIIDKDFGKDIKGKLLRPVFPANMTPANIPTQLLPILEKYLGEIEEIQ